MLLVEQGGADPFAGGALAAALDAIGATTLVLCGDADRIAPAALGAAALGCHAFVVADACASAEGAVLAADLAERIGAEARIVDCRSALAAASVARARQRREAARRR